MSITRNNAFAGYAQALIQIRGTSYTQMWIDDFEVIGPRLTSYSIRDYELVRLGTRHYGFRSKASPGSRLVKIYRCSYLSAIRQFTVHLVTSRLKS